jgi:hypothetical protein
MEIKFKQGDSVAIPEGCKAVIKDGVVVFEKDFKDGDILADHSNGGNIIFIYKGIRTESGSYLNYVMLDGFGYIETNHSCCNAPNPISIIELATEEEKQLLFDKMEEQGLRWNAEEKRVEKIRWVAKDGGKYYVVNNFGHVVADKESGFNIDRLRWAFGNYFHTQEQAEQAADAVKMALMKFHEENE